MASEETQQAGEDGGVATAQDTLSVTDNRTGETYEMEITEGTVRAMDFRGIKVNEDDFGLMTYDPAFKNTASTRSKIGYIDGEAGILEYRGYSIEQLCEHSNYLEVAYLIVYGELPSKDEYAKWEHEITHHTYVHEQHMAAIRLIAKMPTLAAFAYRHNLGLPYSYPDNDLSYPDNFLSMLFKMAEWKYEPDPRLSRALDVLFILHADHEQNASTAAVRNVGSTQVDPYSAIAAGVSALYGPLHGGANEQVLRMLDRIETTDNIPDFLEGVKNREERLMGFGHRVYKNYDPRARIIKHHVDEVLEVTGKSPKLEIAVELEKRALDDDFFTDRKLYPNVDYYSGLIYEALGMPTDMFTVIFAIPRTSGWVGQWLELVKDDEQAIARPRQIYDGYREREYVAIDQR